MNPFCLKNVTNLWSNLAIALAVTSANAAIVSDQEFYSRLNAGNKEVVACSGVGVNQFYTISFYIKDHTTVMEVTENFNKKVWFQLPKREDHDRFVNFMKRSDSIVTESRFKSANIQVGRMKIKNSRLGVRTSKQNIIFDMNSDGDFTTLVIKKDKIGELIQCVKNVDHARKMLDVEY
ncbi:hypothetical protein OPFAMLBM_00315 [Aeromonas phage avDM12-TAAL]|nr:hypothetical protein OPFAMLBM_00315 [Aeromonas phage avDM12-TAAL]